MINLIFQNGVIGQNIAIRSLPSRIHDLINQNTSYFSNSVFENDDSHFGSSKPTHHVIFKNDRNNIYDSQISNYLSK